MTTGLQDFTLSFFRTKRSSVLIWIRPGNGPGSGSKCVCTYISESGAYVHNQIQTPSLHPKKYCVTQKSCPSLNSEFTIKTEQDLLDAQNCHFSWEYLCTLSRNFLYRPGSWFILFQRVGFEDSEDPHYSLFVPYDPQTHVFKFKAIAGLNDVF